jgi:DNA (cytosine-5)-methyltransferase 1
MGKPKVISLYTGAGGLDYGFEAAGFSTAVAVEMNHDSCETLRANRRWPVIERDILRVSSHEILRTAGLRKRRGRGADRRAAVPAVLEGWVLVEGRFRAPR